MYSVLNEDGITWAKFDQLREARTYAYQRITDLVAEGSLSPSLVIRKKGKIIGSLSYGKVAFQLPCAYRWIGRNKSGETVYWLCLPNGNLTHQFSREEWLLEG